MFPECTTVQNLSFYHFHEYFEHIFVIVSHMMVVFGEMLNDSTKERSILPQIGKGAEQKLKMSFIHLI